MSTDEIHVEHCQRCHLLCCPHGANIICPTVKCPQCHISMHGCKVEDHLESICPKTVTTCPNACFGCPHKIRRFRISAHLLNCPASIVVCTREWARKVVSPAMKKHLKQYGKGLLRPPEVEVPDSAIDIKAARSDQKLLIDSYAYPRSYRNSMRDKLNQAHPLLPIREDQQRLLHETECSIGEEVDSSEEENKIKAEKIKKKKEVFANCYMCQVDPSSQHLHTLGGEHAKFKLGKAVRRWPKAPTDRLHELYDLKIRFESDQLPENIVKGPSMLYLKLGGTVYGRKCLKTIRRCEYADHHISQHLNARCSTDDLVVRCPNYFNGCTFTDSRLKPKNGRVRFLDHLDDFAHSPTELSAQYHGFEHMPTCVIQSVAEYLPSSAIRALSMTSRRTRDLIFLSLNDRLMVEIIWTNRNGHWIQGKLKWSFSTADEPCDMIWKPAGALSDHLSVCPFRGEVVDFPERKAVFPELFLENISDEWSSEVQHRRSYPFSNYF